jgi:GNAT superfamily N-acetyltransferase
MIVAAELGDLGQLEGLARRVFGEGDRAAGWFHRKLRREHVDPRLSPVAVRADADASDPHAWLGYVLVGTPPSLGDAVRTAGTGVLPSVRGQGVGGQLLQAAARLAKGAGYRRMELLAEASVVPFYVRHGFVPVLATVTALAFGRGPVAVPAPAPPLPWRALGVGEHEAVAWLPEAWDGTELAARHGLSWTITRRGGGGPVTAWLSREGIAWLVQRLVAPLGVALPSLAAELLARLPAGAPVLLPFLPATATATVELLDAGWNASQRGMLLDRPL